jgi:hypothetical protein
MAVGTQDDTTALKSSIVQQLRQAGLLEHCATTMLAAAQLLQADTETLAAVTGTAAASAPAVGTASTTAAAQGPSTQVRSSSNSSGSTNVSAARLATWGSDINHTCFMAADVAFMLLASQQVDASGSCDVVDAAAGLVAAGVRFLDADTGRSGRGDVNRPWLPGYLVRTLGSVINYVGASSSKQLMKSHNVRAALCLAVLLMHAQSLLPAAMQPAPSAGSSNERNLLGLSCRDGQLCSNSGSSSGRNSSSSVACQQDDLAEPPTARPWVQHTLPALTAAQRLELEEQGKVTEPLQQALGVSIQTVWLLMTKHDSQLRALEATAAAAEAVNAFTEGEWAGLHGSTEQDRQQQEQQQQQQQAASTPGGTPVMQQQELLEQPPQQLLLVRLLLFAVLRQRERHMWCVASYDSAHNAAYAAFCVLARTSRTLDCANHSQSTGQLSEQARRGMRQVLCSWVADAVPIVLQLMAGLLKEADAVIAAPPATTAAVGSRSSSSAQHAESHMSVPSAHEMLAAALQMCARLLCEMGNAAGCIPVLSQEGEAGSSERHGAVPAVWLEHNTAVSAALEGVWRAHAGLNVSSQLAAGLSQLKYLLCMKAPLLSAAQQAGPAAQQQLFSMMCSLFKLCSMVRTAHPSGAAECAWGVLLPSVFTMLLWYHPQRDQLQQPAADRAAPSSSTAAAAAAAAEGAKTAAVAAGPQQQSGAAGGLPWLVLLGRCLLLLAEQLQELQQSRLNLGHLLLQARAQRAGSDGLLANSSTAVLPGGLGVHDPHPVQMVLGVHDSHPVPMVLEASLFSHLLATCRQCLAEGEGLKGLGDLEAAGYPIQDAVQQADAAAAALHVLAAADDAAAASAAYAGMCQQLQALGTVLNTLPMPYAFNSPACVSMLGPSELAAVSGRSCVCGGCRVARYCSRACQRAAWKQHKPVCQALSAAAAGAAATATTAASQP